MSRGIEAIVTIVTIVGIGKLGMVKRPPKSRCLGQTLSPALPLNGEGEVDTNGGQKTTYKEEYKNRSNSDYSGDREARNGQKTPYNPPV
jgi:hypothetical protein